MKCFSGSKYNSSRDNHSSDDRDLESRVTSSTTVNNINIKKTYRHTAENNRDSAKNHENNSHS